MRFYSSLWRTRRDEVVRLQEKQADELKDIEGRGSRRLAELKKILPKEFASALDALTKRSDQAGAELNSQAETIKAELVASTPSRENETAIHPGLAGGHLVAPNSLGWFTPYYGTLHWSSGAVVWQGYNPGNIDLWITSNGSGSGLFGTGSSSGTLIMDWWFAYTAPNNRYYGHTIWVPYHGFYIVRADDGFWIQKRPMRAWIYRR